MDPPPVTRRTTLHKDWAERAERWAGIRSETLEINGVAVHVLRADGPEEAADGQLPQLLVHGLGGSATNWIEVMRGLAKHGPVVAPDLPGFGRTRPPHPRAARVGANAAFLEALLRTLGWDRAVVHGNSMGGMLAMMLTARAPERVAGLVLTAPALPAPRSRMREIDRKTLLRFVPFAIPRFGRVVLRQMWNRMTPEQQWNDTVDFVYGDPSHLTPELREVGLANLVYGRQTDWRLPSFVAAAESLVAEIVRARRLISAIDGADVPTMVVWGEQDQLVGRPVIEHLVERRPEWHLHEFPGIGHVPQVEDPSEYVAVTMSFLAEEAEHLAGDVGAQPAA
jgi:pimeloyl-ACP methyl ester carboxylesterase